LSLVYLTSVTIYIVMAIVHVNVG